MSYALMSESTPKARTTHCCIWCGESILKGETYRHERSVYDGHFQNHKWHLECVEAAGEYFKKEGPDFDPYSFKRPTKK